jgi:hypothetical protein
MDVTLNWSPASSNADQLRREHHAEMASLLGRGAVICLEAATLIGLTGITLVWHRAVSGAMCGTGVMQAMGNNGFRAVIFWVATILILRSWRTLDHIDHLHPQGVLTRDASRMMIVAAPFLILSLFHAWQALMRVATIPTVSCCAAVYDQVVNNTAATTSQWIVHLSLWGNLAGNLVLLILAMAVIRTQHARPGVLMPAITCIWAILSIISIKQIWSAYYYQVLSHPCPWCLFLPDYYGVGFLIFGCLAAVVLESISLGLAVRTRDRYPQLNVPATLLITNAAWRIVIALIGFSLLTAGPALSWRLRTGVWLHGSP